MEPIRLWKLKGCLVLFAALDVGLALPGSAVDIPQEVRDACEKGIAGNRDAGQYLLYCASRDLEGIQNCCTSMKTRFGNGTDDCTCGSLKVIAGRGIDINKLCNTTGIGDKCRAKEEDSAWQAQEEELRKLEPACDRFFKGFFAGETSMATVREAVTCIHAVNKYTTSCHKLEWPAAGSIKGSWIGASVRVGRHP